MVRLLALAIFCVSVSAAAAHDTSGNYDCSSGSALTSLKRLDEIKYRFLKKLADEVDQQFPEDKFYRMGVDRATGPVVAQLQALGKQAASLPVRANFDHELPLGKKAFYRFDTAMHYYLPTMKDLRGRTVVLMFYDEEPAFVVAFVKQLKKHLETYRMDVNLKLQIFAPQMKHQWVREMANIAFGKENVVVRNIANTNEVRHWMSELSVGDVMAVHELPMIDAYGDQPVEWNSKPRDQFLALKADLAKLPN